MESSNNASHVRPTATWDSVSVLKIQSPSGRAESKVFPNGTQVCKVDVIVRFKSGSNDVAITREEAMAATSLVEASTQKPLTTDRSKFFLFSGGSQYTWSEEIMDRFTALPAAMKLAREAYEDGNLRLQLNSNQMIVSSSNSLGEIAPPSSPPVEVEWDPHWLMEHLPHADSKRVQDLLAEVERKPIKPLPRPLPEDTVDDHNESIAVLEHILTFTIAAAESTTGNLTIAACVTRPDKLKIYSNEMPNRSVVTLRAVPFYRPAPGTGFTHNDALGHFVFSKRSENPHNFVWLESAIQMNVGGSPIRFLNNSTNKGNYQLVWSDEGHVEPELWEWGVFFIGGVATTEFRGRSFARETKCRYTRYHNRPKSPLYVIKDVSTELSRGSFSPPSTNGCIPIGRLCSKDGDWILDSAKNSSPHYYNSDPIIVEDEFGTWHSFDVRVADVATLVLIRNW